MLICYHHNDLDGKAAGALVHHMCPRTLAVDTTDSYIMCDYNSKFDKHTIADDVFIVDLSFTEKTYQQLLDIIDTARTVTWIDHHQSSVDMIRKHFEELQSKKNLLYLVDTTFCGAVNVYIYFSMLKEHAKEVNHLCKINYEAGERYEITVQSRRSYIRYGDKSEPLTDQPNVTLKKFNVKNKLDSSSYTVMVHIPMWLAYVDDYDCWKKNYNNSNFFKLGAMLGCDVITPATPAEPAEFNTFWDNLINNPEGEYLYNQKIIDDGIIISKYLEQQYADYRRELGFEWTFNNTKFYCINASADSTVFGNLINRYDAVIMFKRKVGTWVYSVYASENSSFDCRAFCERLGGGGHPKASGFSSEKFIFTDKEFLDRNSNSLRPIIFLGGTCKETDWRSDFINQWKKLDHPKQKGWELFNPIVDDWTPECVKKENQIKSIAMVNLFVITPEMAGPYSCLEAMYCTDNYKSKTVFVIYDANGGFKSNPGLLKSLNECANLLKSKGAIVHTISDENGMEELVKLMVVRDDIL